MVGDSSPSCHWTMGPSKNFRRIQKISWSVRRNCKYSLEFSQRASWRSSLGIGQYLTRSQYKLGMKNYTIYILLPTCFWKFLIFICFLSAFLERKCASILNITFFWATIMRSMAWCHFYLPEASSQALGYFS